MPDVCTGVDYSGFGRNDFFIETTSHEFVIYFATKDHDFFNGIEIIKNRRESGTIGFIGVIGIL